MINNQITKGVRPLSHDWSVREAEQVSAHLPGIDMTDWHKQGRDGSFWQSSRPSQYGHLVASLLKDFAPSVTNCTRRGAILGYCWATSCVTIVNEEKRTASPTIAEMSAGQQIVELLATSRRTSRTSCIVSVLPPTAWWHLSNFPSAENNISCRGMVVVPSSIKIHPLSNVLLRKYEDDATFLVFFSFSLIQKSVSVSSSRVFWTHARMTSQ
jgi:hypothetical protein